MIVFYNKSLHVLSVKWLYSFYTSLIIIKCRLGCDYVEVVVIPLLRTSCFDSSVSLNGEGYLTAGCLTVSCVLLSLSLTGWLVDWADDFSAGFYLSGFCLVLSGVFVVFVDRLLEKKKLPVKQTDLCSDTKDYQIIRADSAGV